VVSLRPAEQIMRLDRMGASHQTRLSFMRALVRQMSKERWRFERLRFDLDPNGYGTSIFAIHTPNRTYSLIAFTHALNPDQRTDRVIAEAWDATFSLFDGVPTDADLARLAHNTPKQEVGRFSATELVLARANKSLRAFEHVVDCLADGRQPDIDFLARVGYLMRTTAVYGSGKFGCADRERISERSDTRGAFQVEMLTVYLIRWFTMELVEYIARARGGIRAAKLDAAVKRFLGIGNATGLGMAPFLVKHPILINNWVLARETALARVRALKLASKEQLSELHKLMTRVRRHLDEWNVDDEIQQARTSTLRNEMEDFERRLSDDGLLSETRPWDMLYLHAEANYSLEGQELAASLLMEPHAELVDDLAETMCSNRSTFLNPSMSVAELQASITARYSWGLMRDYDDPDEQRYFWYYSEDKLEPRFSDRFTEPGDEYEMPLAFGRDIAALDIELARAEPSSSVAKFLIVHPEFRHIVRRVQTTAHFPYSEIHDSLIASDVRPIDLLRFKLAFFGASRFDPKSDLWTRITMFQGAPMPDDLGGPGSDDWFFPVKPEVTR
tara:strand:- start:809 stop:2482 length:1674 start_codon:yes stop_codon:yes gene_type:complete